MNKDQYVAQITIVLEFIEKNIDERLTLEVLAALAGFSPYHFHRIFSAYVGETLSSFIRRIKLQKAAYKLKYQNQNITELALTAGYETPAAFTRAFKQFYGIPPSMFKQENLKQYYFNREESYYDYLKELMMDNFIGIKELDDITVITVKRAGKYSESASQAWSALCKFAYSNSIGKKNKIITPEAKFIGISYDDPGVTPEEKLRYEACISIEQDIETTGEVSKNTISGGKYAVFLHKGPYEKFSDTYNAIFMEWLPSSGEQLSDSPCFELYLNRDPRRTKPENLRTEIYVPLR